MIIAIIIAVAFLIWGVYEFVIDGFEGFFLCALLGFLTFVLCVGLAELIGSCMPESTMIMEPESEFEIVALKDNQGNEGHFFLGSGHINDKLYYYYAMDTERGYKVDKIESSSCWLKYTDDTPRIERYVSTDFKRWYYYLYAIPAVEYYVVHIPEGSLTNEFQIDLE